MKTIKDLSLRTEHIHIFRARRAKYVVEGCATIFLFFLSTFYFVLCCVVFLSVCFFIGVNA